MTRIAITGGRGRLAALAASHFQREGMEVSLFSREAGGRLLPLSDLPGALASHDILLHCAWSTVPLTAEQNPSWTTEQDLPLLRILLEAASSFSTHMIFVSTAAVYGNTGSEPAGEVRPPQPLGNYAKGKLEAEAIIRSSGVSSTVLRVTNLLGERPDPARPQGILPRLVQSARTQSPLTIWGDGSAMKDYLHINDFMATLDGVVEVRPQGTFNVGSGESVTVLQLARLVEAAIGVSVPMSFGNQMPWDVSHSLINSHRILESLGWKAHLRVEAAVQECVAHLP
jgi:UDP-glucose 4-epimerase